SVQTDPFANRFVTKSVVNPRKWKVGVTSPPFAVAVCWLIHARLEHLIHYVVPLQKPAHGPSGVADHGLNRFQRHVCAGILEYVGDPGDLCVGVPLFWSDDVLDAHIRHQLGGLRVILVYEDWALAQSL